MQKHSWQDMYEFAGPSVAQRLVLAGIAGAIVVFVRWLLLGGGLTELGDVRMDFAGRECRQANSLGGWILRLLRPHPLHRVRISEARLAMARSVFDRPVHAGRGIGDGNCWRRQPHSPRLGWNRRHGFVLVGSWINSYAEYQRYMWKLRPENHGHLCTQGLFRYAQHPNYFGDLVLFSGLSLVSGARVTAFIPLLMLGGFVFANVPALDSHLRAKYGAEFDAYARRMRKLIPFVY